jgi:hypothetical protein
MGREGSGTVSIPAPGDGVGESEGVAAPGPRRRETASGRVLGCRAAKTRGGVEMTDIDPEIEG